MLTIFSNIIYLHYLHFNLSIHNYCEITMWSSINSQIIPMIIISNIRLVRSNLIMLDVALVSDNAYQWNVKKVFSDFNL